jgi:transcriptional regulator with XRE-family HTH domain
MFDGQRLRTLRQQAGLSQRQLAERIHHKSQGYIGDLERGSRPGLTADTLEQLALIFHTSTDYLLRLTDDPTPQTRAVSVTRREEDPWTCDVCHQRVPSSEEIHQIQSLMQVIRVTEEPQRAPWMVVTLAGHEQCLEPVVYQMLQLTSSSP